MGSDVSRPAHRGACAGRWERRDLNWPRAGGPRPLQMLSQSLSTVITSWALSGFQFFGETGWAPRAVLRWPGWQENPTASDMGREELFSTVDMILASDCLSIRLVLAGRHRSLHRPLQPPMQCHLDPWQPGPGHQRRPALQVACLQPPDSGRGFDHCGEDSSSSSSSSAL